jgi:hypothetical protein
LVDRLEQKYASRIPLSDLFLFGTPMAPLDKFESAMNAGRMSSAATSATTTRSGRPGRLADLDSASGRPLPRKVVVTSRGDDARRSRCR